MEQDTAEVSGRWTEAIKNEADKENGNARSYCTKLPAKQCTKLPAKLHQTTCTKLPAKQWFSEITGSGISS